MDLAAPPLSLPSDSMKPFCVSVGLWSAVKEHTPLGNGQSKQAVTFPACSQAIELREVLVIEKGVGPPWSPEKQRLFPALWQEQMFSYVPLERKPTVLYLPGAGLFQGASFLCVAVDRCTCLVVNSLFSALHAFLVLWAFYGFWLRGRMGIIYVISVR